MEQWLEHSTFGPPSNPILIRDFLEKSIAIQKRIDHILESYKTEQPVDEANEDEEVFDAVALLNLRS